MSVYSEVSSAYDSWSSSYDTCPNKTRDLDTAVLRAQEFDLKGKDVLEVGCGSGRHTKWLLETQGDGMRSMVAFDLSQASK